MRGLRHQERMNQDKKDFLNLAHPPARVSLTETAWLLGFTEQDVSTLVSLGLLNPLGRPAASGSKYFALAELETLRTDTRWLAKASDATVTYWKKKNAGRSRSLATQTQPEGVVVGNAKN